MKICHSCGKTWDGPPGTQPGRSETCVQCGAYLHCCLNCRLYQPSAYRECTSGTTEPVKDKAAANYCDEFDLGSRGGVSPEGRDQDRKKRWDDLFK